MTRPSPSHGKVLILGLDGATWTVLEPLIARGVMPHLAALRSSGCWGELTSTVPHLTAPAWTTFMTGKNPGKHGVFHFVEPDEEPQAASGTRTLVDARSIKSATLWDILSHHGRRVGVVNLPMIYPPHSVNGFMITGLLTPPGAEVFTYPPELGRELPGYRIEVERFADRLPFSKVGGHEPVPADVALMDDLIQLMEEHAATAGRLMLERAWDVFMIVFAEPDRMGHYLWNYLRAEGLDGTPKAHAIHDAVTRYFRQLDQAIGALVRRAGAQTTVFVISDHGMGPLPSRRVHWNAWLASHGWLVPKEKAGSGGSPDAWLHRLRIPRDVVGRMIHKIPGLRSSRIVRQARRGPGMEVDTRGSVLVYEHMYNSVGGFRLNRSALGPGRPEEIDRRAAALRERLLSELRSLADPKTGKPVVMRAGPRETYYHGPYASAMPDVIVELHPEYSGSSRLSHYFSPITDVLSKSNPGGHWPEGIFVAAGHGIRAAGRLPDAPHLGDIAPTTLHLAGCPVPADMDGRALEDLLLDAFRQSHPVETEGPSDDWFRGRHYVTEALTPDEEAQVMQRLADLGYMAR